MARSSPLWPATSGAILHYAVAVLAVAAAVVAGLVADRLLHIAPFVSLFLCAILFAAWFGGAGPGPLAAGLSILAFDYFFIPPADSFAVQAVPRLTLFAMTALFVIWLSVAQRHTEESLRRARDDLQATVQELEKQNKVLQTQDAERLRAEQSARQAERELQVTIDTIPAIVARYRADGSPEFVNETWRTYTGLPLDSLRGQRFAVAVHPDDLPRVEAAWRAHLPSGQPFQMEQRIRRADGEYRWFFIRRVPLRNENGEVIRWYAAAHDIEDQKRAERALRRSEAYLAEAQRLTNMGSFARKIDWGEMFWSKEIYRITGFDETVKPTDALILQRIHPDDRKFVRQQFDRAVQGDEDYEYECRLLMPDGEVKHIHVRADRQVSETGEEELVGAVMDVTATRKAHEALQLAQTALAHVTRVSMLGEMSASIAHEVNQPLGAIVTNAENSLRWLSRQPPEVEEAVAGMRQIVKDAHRASEVIRRIREFSKKAGPEMSRLDINEIVEEVAMLLRHEALRHEATMELELEWGLLPVRGDRIQLQQVIINLAVNGMQAMADVRDRDRVLVIRTQRQQSDRVLVAVEDVGVGIKSENADRLFSAFYTTKHDGLGMGLSICRSIVEAHGGRVWGASNAGPGMTFQFTISAYGNGS